MRQGGLRAVEQPQDVQLDHALPLLDGRVHDRPEQHHASIVDQHVQAPELADCPLDRSLGLGALGHVSLDCQRAPTRCLYQPGEGLQSVYPARHECHGRAMLGQLARSGRSDTTRGTGYQGNGAVQGRRH